MSALMNKYALPKIRKAKMNYDIHIENLGAIKEANLTITPLTILAGENGTGKSFVTKFLYSVLNTINIDVYSNYTIGIIKRLNFALDHFIEFLVDTKESKNNKNIEGYLDYFKNLKLEFKSISDIIEQRQSDYYELDREIILYFQEIVTSYDEEMLPELRKLVDDSESSKTGMLSKGLLSASIKLIGGLRSPKIVLDRISQYLNELIKLFQNPQLSYLEILSNYITDELKENFQVSEIQHLINSSEDSSAFIIDNLIEVYISKEKGLSVQLQSDYLYEYERIEHILFFESPVYWRLLPIIDDLDNSRIGGLRYNKHYEVLTGIPKYFYDLKKLLFTNFKEGERPRFIVECADDLKKYLKGHFKPTDTDLTFESDDGQSIPKNLVSFGMTNIGIIQAVLSKNIINKGSFVFIDEPESNLHPAWQAILANVLVQLAKNGVYVIITTHSSDMLKAFEISTEEQNINEGLSTYYFESDGKLLEMDDEDLSSIEQARRKLLETYEDLLMRGYLL